MLPVNHAPRFTTLGGQPLGDPTAATIEAQAGVPLVLDLLVAATRADAMVKSGRKDEAWGELARIATELCIATRNRAG